MREDLLDIRDGIERGKFANEASVSQGVVQRVLHLLGWPVWDTGVVSPEHSLGGRRVDYALCHPSHKPLVLIEVKQVGHSEGADKQLFEYAFHGGVPMAILTDGREWSFFLPTERGSYDERRLYKLDILERNPSEIEATLRRYLGYGEMCSGSAMDDARSDYRNAARKREAETALPDAWRKLIESEDDILIDLVSEKVEDICGVKPDAGAVVAFLRRHSQLGEAKPSYTPTPKARSPRPLTKPRPDGDSSSASNYLFLDGQTRRFKYAIEVYVAVFEEFTKRDPDFPSRFVAYPKGRARRPYMARTREALYPRDPDFEGGRKLRGGWWLDTNLNNVQKMKFIKIACEVAGVEYGTELRVGFG